MSTDPTTDGDPLDCCQPWPQLLECVRIASKYRRGASMDYDVKIDDLLADARKIAEFAGLKVALEKKDKSHESA